MLNILSAFLQKINQFVKHDKRLIITFYLLLGIAISFLLRGLFLSVTAQDGSDLGTSNSGFPAGIEITHVPPIITQSNIEIPLDFLISCPYASNLDYICQTDVTLFIAYGSESDFKPSPLLKEARDSLEVWTTNLPVSDSSGQILQYFLEVKDETVGIQSRYPLTGAIELVVASSFTTIDLSTDESPLREGVLILQTAWGNGSDQVGLSVSEGPAPIGPSAFDIAPDGKIAVLDDVNQRVLVFNTITNDTTAYPVELRGWGDISFTNSDEIMVLDLVGENRTPQLYAIDTIDNQVNLLGSIIANNSIDLISGSGIIDINLGRFISPMNSSGTLISEEEQLQGFTTAELLMRWQNDSRSLFVDTQKELFFDIQSPTPLGAIGYFGKTNNGYIMIFEGEYLRILWITPEGQILDDCRIANQQEAPINHLGRFVISQSGNVFYLNTTPEGIEIRRVDINFVNMEKQQ